MEIVQYTVAARIAYITLNRPAKRNALSFEMVSELKAMFGKAENDPDVKVIVLRGAGDVFCSGADLAMLQQLQEFSLEQNLTDSRHLGSLFYQIYHLKKVVIAQVEGHALAGGFGLAMVCDFTFVVPEARLGFTEVKIGFIPAIVMIFLLRRTGEQRAKQLLLTGDIIAPELALQMGIVTDVVSKALIGTSVATFAARLIQNNSGTAMELTKKMIADVQSMAIEEAIEYAAQMNAQARGSDDCKRGITAFLEKKHIDW